jgi:hypothetical protein
MGMRRWWNQHSPAERALPIFLVAAVVGGGTLAFGPAVFSGLFDGDQVFSLCPDDRASTQIVSDSRMIEEAPEYQGPGPHRLIVDGPSGATEGMREDWVVPRESNGRYRIDQLQLVVCEYRYAVGTAGDLQMCPYTPVGGGQTSTFTAQSAKYDYKVYEATTGKQLTDFTLDGVTKDCADFRTVVGESAQHSKFPAYPDYDELERKLEPLVMADATS